MSIYENRIARGVLITSMSATTFATFTYFWGGEWALTLISERSEDLVYQMVNDLIRFIDSILRSGSPPSLSLSLAGPSPMSLILLDSLEDRQDINFLVNMDDPIQISYMLIHDFHIILGHYFEYNV